MNIKYKVDDYDVSIREVEVERETDHSVWINGNRSQKISSWCKYYDDYESAFKYLDKFHSDKLDLAKRRLESAEINCMVLSKLIKPVIT